MKIILILSFVIITNFAQAASSPFAEIDGKVTGIDNGRVIIQTLHNERLILTKADIVQKEFKVGDVVTAKLSTQKKSEVKKKE